MFLLYVLPLPRSASVFISCSWTEESLPALCFSLSYWLPSAKSHLAAQLTWPFSNNRQSLLQKPHQPSAFPAMCTAAPCLTTTAFSSVSEEYQAQLTFFLLLLLTCSMHTSSTSGKAAEKLGCKKTYAGKKRPVL